MKKKKNDLKRQAEHKIVKSLKGRKKKGSRRIWALEGGESRRRSNQGVIITDNGAIRKDRKVELRPASVLHGGDDAALDTSVLVGGAEQSSKELGRQAA